MARIIAMDEVGNFESRNQGVRFIGGFVYNADYELTKKHLETFLIELCNEANETIKKSHIDYNVLYPDSLHGSGNVYFRELEENGNKQWQPVPREECKVETEVFKKFIQEKVMGYLKNINDLKIFVYLDPYTGGGYDDLGENSNITDMSQGSNRYERMALQAIYHKIFYTFDEEPDEYIFEIATRSLPKKNVVENEMYSETNGMMSITNTSTYKTAISTTLYDKGMKSNAKYVFHVAPINYFNSSKYPTTPYTYLADIVCTYLRGIMQKQFNLGGSTAENVITSEGLCELIKNNDIEMFVYSKADVIYRKMVEAIKEHRIVDYYGYLYEMLELKDDIEEENVQGCMTLEIDNIDIRTYKKFYLENWIEGLNKSITDKLEKDDNEKRIFRSMINDYVAYVEGYMGCREISYEKGFFIAEKLLGHVEVQSQWKNQCKILFKLYDIKLRGYNHRGSIDNVKLCAEKCNLYKAYVSTEEYVLHILRVIEYYLNSFRFNEALEESSRLIKVGEKLEDTYKEVYSTSEEVAKSILGDVNPVQSGQLTIVGKIYSNLGQVYAFLRDYENSRKMFEKALEKFSIGTDDYKITQSYYLHLFIDNNKMHEYNKESVFYFGSDNIKEQLLNAVEYNAYAIYVFIKAYRTFYVQDYLNRDILEDIISIISSIDSTRRTSHPWELIYKNLSECLLIVENANPKKKVKYMELADKYAAKCQMCNQNADTTIDLIQINAKLEFMKMKDMIEEDGVVENLDPKEIRNCEKILNCKAPIRYKQLKEFLDDKITYMYR